MRYVTVETDCALCGSYRAALLDELDIYECAGGCGLAAKVRFAIEGFTRRPIITEWMQVAKPLSADARQWLMSEGPDLFDRPALAIVRRIRRAREKDAIRFRRYERQAERMADVAVDSRVRS